MNVAYTPPGFLSIEKAADRTGYHPEHLRRLARDDKIASIRVGSICYVSKEDLERYAAARNGRANGNSHTRVAGNSQPIASQNSRVGNGDGEMRSLIISLYDEEAVRVNTTEEIAVRISEQINGHGAGMVGKILGVIREFQ